MVRKLTSLELQFFNEKILKNAPVSFNANLEGNQQNEQKELAIFQQECTTTIDNIDAMKDGDEYSIDDEKKKKNLMRKFGIKLGDIERELMALATFLGIGRRMSQFVDRPRRALMLFGGGGTKGMKMPMLTMPVNALLLRQDIFDGEQAMCIMYSPDLPQILPLFALHSIAFNPTQQHSSLRIGQWFRLELADYWRCLLDRLKGGNNLNCPNYPIMECTHPPRSLHSVPILPISRVRHGNVQVLINFETRSICEKTGLVWCRAIGNFPSILDTQGQLAKIIGLERGEKVVEFTAWCELRKYKFAHSDWKMASIVKMKRGGRRIEWNGIIDG